MRRYLPLILFVVGAFIFLGAFILIRGRKSSFSPPSDKSSLIDVPVSKRPFVSLVPRPDGHYVDMRIEKLMIPEAKTLDYEFFYYTKESSQPLGVQGSKKIEGVNSVEEEFLFGSVSSGTPRFDEGVERGVLTLRFRNGEGDLISSFETEFNLLTGTSLLASVDNTFKYQHFKESKDFFVVMNTIGYPGEDSYEIKEGPYGVFSSSDKVFPGKVDLGEGKIYFWNGKEWKLLENDNSENIGIFFTSNQ